MFPEADVAIIGLACRFPKSPDAARFWSLISNGRHGIGPAGSGRRSDRSWHASWPPHSGRGEWQAGFIEGVDEFDAVFFGIAPREAEQMDPQQRLLLEVTWEALEAAGETRERLQASRTGVYVGISSVDYARIQPRDALRLDAYSATGNAQSLAANRLSYVFDLRGPSLAVDTACSSSLVAVHLACRALRSGEIDRAIVGGVNLILSPDLMIVFSAARMLASDGRCKTFDARADGYVRGEGCGVIVLKRLSDARTSRDPVVATIRGSATNQDGRSNGLTAPNGHAQQAVIQEALADAGLGGEALDAVELHGTGTALGDPIEALALGTALGTARPADRPCQVGSVKTNIGHLEAAAGIAGLIKAALALQHGTLPPSLNFERPNPEIPLPALGLAVATAAVPLPASARIGVSSFGFGGTNAHVVLESAPAHPLASESVRDGPWVLPLSAHTAEALRALCRQYTERLTALRPEALADVVYTASVRRTHHDQRVAAIGEDAAALARSLAQFDSGAASGLHRGRRAPAGPRKLALWLGPLRSAGSEQVGALVRWSATFLQHCEMLKPALAACGLPEDLLRIDTEDASLARAQAVALLAAMVAEVRGWGLSFATIAGTGAGADIAAWCRGERSLAEAIAAALARRGETGVPRLPERTEMLSIGDSMLTENLAADTIAAGSAQCLARAQAKLYALGHALDWTKIQPPGRVVPLPSYPWQRQRFWFDSPTQGRETLPAAAVSKPSQTHRPQVAEEDPAGDWVAVPSTHADHTLEQLDAICAAFTCEALINLGWSLDDQPLDTDRMIDACRVAPQRVAVFRNLLARLMRFGISRDIGLPQTSGGTRGGRAVAMLDALAAVTPALSTELSLLRRTATALAGVLRGDVHPLPLLFPHGELHDLRRLYGGTPAARLGHRLLLERIRAAFASGHRDKPVRIIEIGAGTGGTTEALLQGLADIPTDYVFTDISTHFLADAARTFGDRATYRPLDIECLPADQGFADASFDVVVATNVLHATRSLRDSVEHARRLLAPGGVLLLLEITQPSWALELTFGLTDGLWRFRDHDLRPHQPVVDAGRWLDILGKAGFDGCYALPCDPRGDQALISGVLGASVSRPRWLLLGGEVSIGRALAQAIHAHGGSAISANTGAIAAFAPAADAAEPPCHWDYIVDLTALGRSERADTQSPKRHGFAEADVWTVVRTASAPEHAASRASPTAIRFAPPPRAPRRQGRGGCIDLDDAPPERAAQALLCAIQTCGSSGEIAIRGGCILVPRGHAELLGIEAAEVARAGPAISHKRVTNREDHSPTMPEQDLALRVADAFPAERSALLGAHLVGLAAAVLKLPPEALDPERGLQEQGMDSLMALELRARLQQLTSTPLPATLPLERPTIRSLTEYLLPILAQAAPARRRNEPAAARVAVPSRAREEAGSRRFEGNLPGLIASIAQLSTEEAFRRLLRNGHCE